MCKLSHREKEVLEMLKNAQPEVVALRLHISRQAISTYKTRARRKEARAQKFLEEIRQYRDVLHPKPRYRGL